MNYFIDFDNTLYETAKLTSTMLDKTKDTIIANSSHTDEEIQEYIQQNFNSTTAQIFSFAEQIAKDFGVDSRIVTDAVKNVIANGGMFIFEDAERFLQKIKSRGDTVTLVTFIPKGNESYQKMKIASSGLMQYFDKVIITPKLKGELDLDYSSGVVIDDSPRDITQLLERNPKRMIRIKKLSNKRSKIEMDDPRIEEYESFDDINIDVEKKNKEKVTTDDDVDGRG